MPYYIDYNSWVMINWLHEYYFDAMSDWFLYNIINHKKLHNDNIQNIH